MSFLKDTLSIFKKNELAFIKKDKESEEVYTFLFEKVKDVTWHAGQHGLFTITHKKIKNGTRPLSVASSPTENVIKITTKINGNPSEFKRALMELEKGMTISMSGPVGSFYLKDSGPTLFIAGGIGITPFRAMAKELEAEDNAGGKPMKLLYIDSEKEYLYKDELDEIEANTSVDVTYPQSRDDLYQEVDQFISSYGNNAKYFIAGPKSMTDLMTTYLKNKKISKQNIKKDTFTGY
ncbi:FAD-dependent oxidoreductase [Bacillus sp. H-16]|uniref:FAD-dependent oxidoreductase n=1 Tax=Alteribacter salitolerans TaxID=2912333 RepID=UPI00196437E6|nr:FAD-dependent oxidoreductase [Alteribacter salitolerans]MBM7095092.1 FAD-dependent oxidoreductase [Alteribacter salitolerans]